MPRFFIGFNTVHRVITQKVIIYPQKSKHLSPRIYHSQTIVTILQKSNHQIIKNEQFPLKKVYKKF